MMYENKLYVVIGVLLIILIGLFVYLFAIDQKLRRLEKKHRKMQPDYDDNGPLIKKSN